MPDPGRGGMQIAGLEMFDIGDVGADYGRFLLHGPQGSGKSFLGATIAEIGPTLYVDMRGERGTRSFTGTPYAKNIKVIRPRSIQQLDELFYALDKGNTGFKAVVLDSLTAVQKMTMRFLLGHSETAVREISQGVAPADQRTWGQALDIMSDVPTFWYSLADAERANPMHVVLTAQTKITEDEVNQVTSRVPDVQRGAQSITLATPDFILYTDTELDYDNLNDEGDPATRHIARFGNDRDYRIKARVPAHLHGKIPPVLGRKGPMSLVSLGRALGLGGIPAKSNSK